MEIYDQYEVVIGLEVHIQLSTQTKAFCADDSTYGGAPNTQVSSISLGLPGTLPRLNEKQVAYAVRLGLALRSEINTHSYFDRKNYFYTDLPKGYQITQDAQPICKGGHIKVGDVEKVIRIHHIHMEEDAGKSIHDQHPHFSLIDLNRAGTPLLEVVTEPDFRSAQEVDDFMNQMRQLVRYLDISDGNMEQGSMRCDCNISVRKKGEETFGERCEVKNMNSMRFARKAIEYEFKRQVDLLQSGQRVQQQTLNFDPVNGTTSPLRDKEDAHDYRYFPEPDLPPVILQESYIADIKSGLPALPWEIKSKFIQELGLSDYDAKILTADKATAFFFEELAKAVSDRKAAANLTINKILPYCQENNLDIAQFPVATSALRTFLELISEGKVSASIAYQRLFPSVVEQPLVDPLKLAQQMQLLQSDDSDFLEQLIKSVIEKYPDKVAAYKKGKKGLIGFFMGEVMRNSKGKAEPKSTNERLRKRLEE